MEMEKQIDSLIEDFCNEIELPVEILKITGYHKPKIYKGIIVSQVRQSLCYHLVNKYPHLSLTYICRKIGYKDHSTWVKQWKVVHNYIKTNDKVFSPYWTILQRVASNPKYSHK